VGCNGTRPGGVWICLLCNALGSQRPYSTMRPSFLAPVLMMLAAAPRLTSQTPLGPAPGRAYILRQQSYWLTDGFDSTRISAVDTTLTVVLDSVQGQRDTLSFRYDFEPSRLSDWAQGRGNVALTRGGRFAGLRLESERPRMTDAVPALVSLLVELPWWIVKLPKHAGASWRDSLAVLAAYERDTVIIRRVRSSHAVGETVFGGRTWQRVRASGPLELRATRRVDIELQDSVWLRTGLTGNIEEEFLYDPSSGATDSLKAHGTLTGTMVFAGSTGHPDTVTGRWVFRRTGAWGVDPRGAQAAAMQFFVTHGRDSAQVTDPGDRYRALRERVNAGDTTLLDSLLVARTRPADPFARQVLDTALRYSGAGTMEARFLRVAGAAYRSGDRFLLNRLLWSWQLGTERAVLPLELAKTLSEQLASLSGQRRGLLDREETFSLILDGLSDGGGVERAAGPILAAAAQRADDPCARDLLLLAAYQADPAAYLPLLQKLADSLQGYGPITREYVEGNGSMTNWSWGVERGQKIDGRRFPGVNGSWQDLARYLRDRDPEAAEHRFYVGLFGSSSADTMPAKPLRLWLEARRIDGHAAFRQRFLQPIRTSGVVLVARDRCT